MKKYNSKNELIEEIEKNFNKYILEFEAISDNDKDKRIDEVKRTPFENLAYQVGWTDLLSKWERDEKNGIHVKTPHDNYKWNELGKLQQWFYREYSNLSLENLKEKLSRNVDNIIDMIMEFSDEDLFEPHKRVWADEATKTASWEVYKFIHINTVAPFKSFRTEIRKWKKLAL